MDGSQGGIAPVYVAHNDIIVQSVSYPIAFNIWATIPGATPESGLSAARNRPQITAENRNINNFKLASVWAIEAVGQTIGVMWIAIGQ